jgi:hypothetical protein
MDLQSSEDRLNDFRCFSPYSRYYGRANQSTRLDAAVQRYKTKITICRCEPQAKQSYAPSAVPGARLPVRLAAAPFGHAARGTAARARSIPSPAPAAVLGGAGWESNPKYAAINSNNYLIYLLADLPPFVHLHSICSPALAAARLSACASVTTGVLREGGLVRAAAV